MQDIKTMLDAGEESDSLQATNVEVTAVSQKVQREPEVQDPEVVRDATKAEFEMPSFDELARIRPAALVEAGLPKQAVDDACGVHCTGNWFSGRGWSGKAKKGFVKEKWEADHVGAKLRAFALASPDNGKITFHEFVQIAEFDPSWKQSQHEPPENITASNIAKWLAKEYGYWRYFSGKTLAKAYEAETTTNDACQGNFQACPLYPKLQSFADLDKDHNAELTFDEIAPSLSPTTDVPAELKWSGAAAVEATDFASLNFPSHLVEDIVSMGESGRITSAKWDELELQKTLAEFVKRDKRPHTGEKEEELNGIIKFYQIADILPAETNAGGNIILNINGEDSAEIHVPTLDEVAGEGQTGVSSLMPKDIEAWLQKEEQGMKNSWSMKFWSDKNKHAKNMALDVIRWGDGSIPGQDRPGAQNGRIQGADKDGNNDQWTDVAPRLTAFVHLDMDHDGGIDFSMANPYLKKVA